MRGYSASSIPCRFVIAMAALTPGCAGPGATHGNPPTIPSGVTAHEQTSHYDLVGETADDLRKELDAKGPRDEGGRSWGLHSWKLSWVILTANSISGCRIEDAHVLVESTILLPRWSGAALADPTLAAQWEGFATAILAHEYDHRRLVYSAARKVRGELLGLSSGNCDLLRVTARARGNEVVAAAKEQNAAFDLDTRGGRSAGVVWPPAQAPERASERTEPPA